jgi:hypothetical protein
MGAGGGVLPGLPYQAGSSSCQPSFTAAPALVLPLHAGSKSAHTSVCTDPSSPSPTPRRRDNPRRELELRVQRGAESLTLAITPAEMPDGSGRIGVSLAANADVVKRRAGDPLAALELGSREFGQLAGAVTRGAQLSEQSAELNAQHVAQCTVCGTACWRSPHPPHPTPPTHPPTHHPPLISRRTFSVCDQL